MLKKLVKRYSYGHVDDDILDLYSEYFKFEVGIELLLRYRISLYIGFMLALAIDFYYINVLLACIALCCCVFYIGYTIEDFRKHRYLGNPKSFRRAHKMTNWIMGHIVLKKQLNAFLTKKEIDSVKKCKKLYCSLIDGSSIGLCYTCALEFAMQINDAYLVYAGIKVPGKDMICAHAFVLKDGKIFDTNRRTTISIEDYYTLYKVKEYRIWSYEEYSDPNFRECVSKDFHNWCKENQVCKYRYF